MNVSIYLSKAHIRSKTLRIFIKIIKKYMGEWLL